MTDLQALGFEPSPSREAMISAVSSLLPQNPIMWMPYVGPEGNEGFSRVLSDRVEIWINVSPRKKSSAQQKADLEYVVAHELGHVIVRARGAGSYPNWRTLREPGASTARDAVPLITSTLEHPCVHAVMAEYGNKIPEVGKDPIDRLLLTTLAQFAMTGDRLPEFEAFQQTIWLTGYLTAFKTARSPELAGRIATVAPAFSVILSSCVSVVEQFFNGLIDANAASSTLCRVLRQPDLARFFVSYEEWVQCLPPANAAGQPSNRSF